MGTPVMLIRGGTSRGVFFREEDLPCHGPGRDAVILRAFGHDGGLVADGLGGELPVLRKVAIVSHGSTMDDSATELRYTFVQVDARAEALSTGAECGNVAAGVPLFGWLSGWVPPPAAGQKVSIQLANSGKRAVAEWIGIEGMGGVVRLRFLDPAPQSRDAALLLGEATSAIILGSRRVLRCTVVQGTNTYAFIQATDLGMADPAAVPILAPLVMELLRDAYRELASRLGEPHTLKMGLVAPVEGRPDAVSAHIVYPAEGRSHPSFAVTGAIALVACLSVEGSVLSRPLAPGESGKVSIRHPSGTLEVHWSAGPSGLPRDVSIERTCRLILTGTLY